MNTICVLFLFCSMVASGGVPSAPGMVSRFQIPYGNVYLAHNDLDGRYFSELAPGQFIRFYDGNEWIDYEITEVIEAQALEPRSLTTPLMVYGKWRSPEWVHRNIYTGMDRLVLQTCIYKDGNWSWGRLFIVSERLLKEIEP